jgi:hypothetical protein
MVAVEELTNDEDYKEIVEDNKGGGQFGNGRGGQDPETGQ